MSNQKKPIKGTLKYKTLLNNLAINVIVVVCSFICTIFSYTKFDTKIVTNVCYVLMIFLLVFVVYLYIQNSIYEYKEIKNKFIEENEKSEIIKAIPHLLIFSKREDHFIVQEDGDGILEWRFHIVKETEGALNYIYFPVMYECASTTNAKNVDILDARVNGKSFQATYNPNAVSTSVAGGFPIELGEVSVPILLDKGRQEFDLFIRIKIKGLFCNFRVKEFVVVDIPYITKHLSLSIEMPKDYEPSLPSNFFEAHETSSVSTLDSEEVSNQMSKCKRATTSITWETDYPKLGYRYRLFFKAAKG